MKLAFILWVRVRDDYKWLPVQLGSTALFLAKAPAVLSSNTFANDKKVGPGQTVRFKTAIQYFKVLWILHQYLSDCQVFIHKNKDSCRFVDAETRKTSKTASSAKAMELPFCKIRLAKLRIICLKTNYIAYYHACGYLTSWIKVVSSQPTKIISWPVGFTWFSYITFISLRWSCNSRLWK